MEIGELIKTKKVLICCGSGGVGKTTISASIAVRAAQLGLKVLVLTIDPARRLATSLGIDGLTGEDTRVGEKEFPGEMYAALLDAKRVFDDYIKRLAPSDELANKILENKIYRQLSTALSSSQEYSSLERLLQAHQKGNYDLIVLDTPPTKHAIDFLNAPGKVNALFHEGVIKWFVMPFVTLEKFSLGIVNRGTKAALKAFEKLAGSEFLSSVTEFFVAIKDWQGALRNRATEVHMLLTSPETGFLLVTGFDAVRIDEARYFQTTLENGGYNLECVIVNRIFPFWEDEKKNEIVTEKPGQTDQDYEKFSEYFQSHKKMYRSQNSAFMTFAGEMKRKSRLFAIPDLESDVHDLDGLKLVAQQLGETMHGH